MNFDLKRPALFGCALIAAYLTACSTGERQSPNTDLAKQEKPLPAELRLLNESEMEMTEEIVVMQDLAGSSEDDAFIAPTSPVVAASEGKAVRQKAAKPGENMGFVAMPTPIPDSETIIEPNTENYAPAAETQVKITRFNPVSTFSVDVDTASYTNVRRLLNQGVWPQAGAVRVEELINYFDYRYEVPANKKTPFNVITEVANSPWNPQTQLLQVALQGYEVAKTELPPMNLVFLLDVSGSMNQANKLPLLKRSFSLLTQQLRPQDQVAIVVYAGASGVVLEPTAGNQQQTILAALDRLNAGGSTNGAAGIELAYQTIQQAMADNDSNHSVNRVILATDGDFNVGTTNMDSLKKLVETKRNTGVFLSILGFGTGNYNDYLMEELSNIGNGNAFYIDSFQEARKVFAENLTGTLHTIAKDVKIQIEFNPKVVSEYRLIGYDNRRLKQEDFNNDKIDAGEIGAGHSVTALYEIVLTSSEFRFNDPLRYQQHDKKTESSSLDQELAFVKLRYKMPDSDTSKLVSQPVTLENSAGNMDLKESSSALRFSAAVAGFGEILRQNPRFNTGASNWSLEDAAKLAQSAIGNDPWGYRHEFVQLVQNAQSLQPQVSMK